MMVTYYKNCALYNIYVYFVTSVKFFLLNQYATKLKKKKWWNATHINNIDESQQQTNIIKNKQI